MKVLFPERILNRHVGGNTTYAAALRDGLVARGVDVDTIPATGNPIMTMFAESAYGLKRQQRGTLLHYSADTGPLLPARAPSVVTVHGVASRWINVARNGRQEWVWRKRVERAIKSTDRLVTVSRSAQDDIAEIFNIDRERIAVIPHGIEHQRFSDKRTLSSDLVEKLGNKPYVLYLGNVEPRKNIIELVRAFEQAPLKGAVQLVIAGRPAWNFDEAMSAIESSKQCTYLGFVSDDDRIALMQNAELFAFPSLYEGFGFPVLEAMAAGTPVATSRRGSLAEVAGPAWLLEELDAKSLANEIANALGDSAWRASVVEEGIQWASKFTWDSSLEAHMRVYESVIS